MVLLALAVAGCGWQRAGTGTDTGPAPATTGRPAPERVPQLYDPTAIYTAMGLITEQGDLPYVGAVHILGGPAPDTAVVAIGLSLRARNLTFRRDNEQYVAEYRVELQIRQGTAVAQQAIRDERVRVATYRETQRTDESVIFQQFVTVPAGQYVMSLVVRDRNGPNSSRYEQVLVVPTMVPPAVARPIAVYAGDPRTSPRVAPPIIVNPRSTVSYGADTLRFYVEAYGAHRGSRLVATARDAAARVVWGDTTRLDTDAPLAAALFTVPPGRLSLGRYELGVVLDDSASASAPFLVAFSDQYAAGNLDDVVSLLRYFPGVDSLRAVLQTPLEQRADAWQRFWRQSDPNPATPENEALDEYFGRMQTANEQFREEGIPGWLTERGEVFITLGEPDDVVDRRPELGGRGRIIYWVYSRHQLTLAFVDDGGFGRFRMDARSRAEFARVAIRLRTER